MNQIGNLLERPKLYNNIDGVGELTLGLMCLGFAAFEWMSFHASRDSFWNGKYSFLVFLTVMCSVLHYGSKAIKNRITFPRTGFVDYKARDKYWMPFILGACISGLLSAGLVLARRRHWEASTLFSLGVGLLLSGTYIRIARTVRWKWVVFAVVVAGVLAIAALPADIPEAFVNHVSLTRALPAKVLGAYWLTFVLYGAALMMSGAISFWWYVRHTQAPAQEER